MKGHENDTKQCKNDAKRSKMRLMAPLRSKVEHPQGRVEGAFR